MPEPIFKRVLLKLSGEALAAKQGFGVDPTRIHEIAAELGEVHSLGVQIAIVMGGGNFFRGVAEQARNTMFGLYDMFSGGNLSRVTIFALGIMPYRTSTPGCRPRSR